jgi:hypothetical protein
MEHPFLHDVHKLSLEEIGKKLSELYKKLAIAQRTGNGYLCGQIMMAIESYRSQHQVKLDELYRPQPGQSTPDFDSKIDIS